MISVAELDNIARARIEDSKALLTAGRCSDLPDSRLDRVSRHWQRVPGLQELPDPRTRRPAAPFGAGGADQAEPLSALERRGHLEGRIAIQCCRHGAAT